MRFLIEALVLSIFGGLIGIVVWPGFTTVAVCFPQLPFIFDAAIVLVGLLFAVVVGFVFACVSARRAAGGRWTRCATNDGLAIAPRRSALPRPGALPNGPRVRGRTPRAVAGGPDGQHHNEGRVLWLFWTLFSTWGRSGP